MAKKIRGRFYFKKTTNGNLIGEWSNYEDAHIYTEGADAKLPGNENYDGYYFSTWQENGVPQFAELEIKRDGSKFSMVWRENETNKFVGEAMLCDNVLIGDYYQP